MSMLKLSGIVTALVLVGLAYNQSQTGIAADKQAGIAAAAEEASSKESAGWIGVMLDEDSKAGARVKQVFPGGPAAYAGIREGDVVVSLGDKKLNSTKALIESVEKMKPGTVAKIAVDRKGRMVELGIVIGHLGKFHENYINEMMRRDPNDPDSAKFAGVSESDMNAEMFRRLMEQNHRLETMLHAVHKEVKELRAEVQALKK